VAEINRREEQGKYQENVSRRRGQVGKGNGNSTRGGKILKENLDGKNWKKKKFKTPLPPGVSVRK